jgi:hypothetical protein
MSLFPKIARTCPWLDRLDEAMEGDFCRMCQRTVHDLTEMDDGQRAAFLTACGGDACIKYTAYVRPAVAAALVAASAAVLVPVPAMAQRQGAGPQTHRPHVAPPRARRHREPPVAVVLGGAPPLPVMLAGEPVPVDPPKPPEPLANPKRD